MNRLLLLTRLAGRNVRHRPGQSALLLLALCLATSSLAIGLNVSASGDGAIQRLTDATKGYHVYLKGFSGPEPSTSSTVVQQAMSQIADRPGVTAVGGPWPVLLSHLTVEKSPLEVRVQVRNTPAGDVDQPAVTNGTWLDGSEGVVIEDGLADSLHLRAGDSLTLDGHSFPVLGTAMTASTQRFPLESPGIVWSGPAAAARLTSAPVVYPWLMIRLDDPNTSVQFAQDLERDLPRPEGVQWEIHEWQERHAEEEASNPVKDLGLALLLAGTLLAILTTATAAVLIGGRLAERTRQLGVLKAIGSTPLQVTGVLLIEAGALALIAVVVGTGVGVLLAPRLADTVTVLYGGPQVDVLNPGRIGTVTAIALALVLVAVVLPAARATRAPTSQLLEAAVRPPTRASHLGRLTDRLGLPVYLGTALRTLLRRPGRLIGNLVALVLGVALAVLGLLLRGASGPIEVTPDGTRDVLADAAAQELFDKIRVVVLIAAALLVVLAIVNTIVTASFTALDARRSHAVLAALGASPGQITTGFMAAQLLTGLLATAAGLALGQLMYRTFGNDLTRPELTAVTYLVLAAGTIGLYLLAVLVPARVLARQPIATTLAAEHA